MSSSRSNIGFLGRNTADMEITIVRIGDSPFDILSFIPQQTKTIDAEEARKVMRSTVDEKRLWVTRHRYIAIHKIS